MKKRSFSIFLALMMVLTGVFPAFAEADTFPSSGEATSYGFTTPARAALERQARGLWKAKDEAVLIVELDTDAFREFGRSYSALELRDRANFEPQSEFAERANREALRRIEEAGIDFQPLYTMDILLVGFTGKATYEDALKIAELPFIKAVELSAEYHAPDTRTEIQDRMPNSNRIIGQDLINAEYDGSGSLVAILDSGADFSHPAFYLTDKGREHKRLKFDNQNDMKTFAEEKGITTPGIYLSEKIPFAYNYYDKTTVIKDTNKRTGMHGQHVAGTVGGNRQELVTGETFLGVAPESQLLILRVFGQVAGTTGSGYYLPAMNDAVKFGADSINMSLGSPAGLVSEVNPAVNRAIENASTIGCIVAIAGGNDGYFGEGATHPNADNPDYGVVGTPGIAPGSMCVASMENTHSVQPLIKVYEDDVEVYTIPYLEQANPNVFDESKPYPFADAGQALNVDNLPDLTGKIALVERGVITFEDKVRHCAAKGAVGVIVYNNEPNGNDTVAMAGLENAKIPAISIRRDAALELLSAPNRTLLVKKDPQLTENVMAGRISDFSSWGLSGDGFFKPDIMAPGGKIYSTMNDGQYASMNGTSMATPHVAGGVALVRSRVDKDFPNLTGAEKYVLQRQLLMSTAKPHRHPETGAVSSPRNQGAGYMYLPGALRTKAVVYDEKSKETKLNLGDVEDRFSFSFTLKNLSDDTLSYDVVTHVVTDQVEEKKMTLAPEAVLTVPGGEVTVAPKSEVTVTVTADTSEKRDELLQLMKNGYFLEGFTVLTGKNGEEELSVPFIGFRGNYANLPSIEPFINELAKEDREPTYYDATLGEKNVDFTHFWSNVEGGRVIMGQAPDYSLTNYSFVEPVLSPNNDGKLDSMNLQATYLRTHEGLSARVFALDEAGEKIDEGKQIFSGFGGTKHHFSRDPTNNKSVSHADWRYPFGTQGRPKDGKYLIEVSAVASVPGAKPRAIPFTFTVDTEMPRIVSPRMEGNLLRFDIQDRSGIMTEEVSYRNGTEEVVIPKTGDGYVLPAGIDRSQILVKLVDFGYNTLELTAEEVLENPVFGSISFEAKVTPATEPVPPHNVRVVTNDAAERQVDPSRVKVGSYKVFVSDYPVDWRLTDKMPILVEVTEAEPNVKVALNFEKVHTGRIQVNVELNDHPEDFRVFAVNEVGGEEFELQKSIFWSIVKAMEAEVPEGDYRFVVKGGDPEYKAIFEPQKITVTRDGSRSVNLKFVPAKEFRVHIRTNPDTLTPTYSVYDKATGEITPAATMKWEIGSYRIYPQPVDGYYPNPPSLDLELTPKSGEETTLEFRFFSSEGTGAILVEDNSSTTGMTAEYVAMDFYRKNELPNGKLYEDLSALKPGIYYVLPKEGSFDPSWHAENMVREVLVERDRTARVNYEWKRILGKITAKAVDENDAPINSVLFELRDSEGRLQTDWNSLVFGTYEVKAADYNRAQYELTGAETISVIIDEAAPEAEAVFRFTKKNLPSDSAEIVVTFETYRMDGHELPDGFTVHTFDAENRKIEGERVEKGKYRLTVPAGDAFTTYTLHTACTVDGYVPLETYKNVRVKVGQSVRRKVLVGLATSLPISSRFSDGADLPVRYRAVRTSNDDSSGAIYTDMNQVYAFGEYLVSPIEVPTGYSVSPAEQEATRSGDSFIELIFRYTRTAPLPTKNVLVSVENPPEMTVDYGTAWTELNLPTELRANFEERNDGGKLVRSFEETVTVEWNAADYRPEEPGAQEVRGTLRSTALLFENPNGVEAIRVIVVKEKEVAPKEPTPIDPTPLPEPEPQPRPEPPKRPTPPKEPAEQPKPVEEKKPAEEKRENAWRTEWATGLTADSRFRDIAGHPSEAAIRFAVANGIFKGISETEFRPEETLTRAMLVAILHRLTENPTPGAPLTFTDVPQGAYYERALRWATANGIITGYADGTFRGDATPTAEEFAVMLDRYVNLVQVLLLPLNDGTSVRVDGAGGWALRAIDRMLSSGVMTGTDGVFLPKANLTRAEVAQILKNLYDATIRLSFGR